MLAVALGVAGVTLVVWNWVVIIAVTYVIGLLIRQPQRTGAAADGAVARAFRTRPATACDRVFLFISALAIIAAAVLFDWPLWGWLIFASLIGLLATVIELAAHRFGNRSSRTEPS